MTNKTITVGEVLGIEKKFDPMDLDITEIKELSNALPKDGNIDINNAEILATKYLRGLDVCGELAAAAIAHVSKTKDIKQQAYNRAFLIKSSEHKNIKTDKMRVAFAELDNDYMSACVVYNRASAFAKWIDSKCKSFEKMHYLCKKLLDRAYVNESASSWNPTIIEKEDSW